MIKFAIVTNDLQVAAAKKHSERQTEVAKFLPTLIKFLEKMRSLSVPIIHLQLVVSDDDPRSLGIPEELQFRKGTEGVKILPEVYEVGDIVIQKPKDSGFFQTDLEKTLQSFGINTVVVSGMQTQICVQTTAADAYFRSYKVLVPSDGVVSTRPEDTIQALHWIANYCGTVLTCQEIESLVEKELGGTR